MKAVILGGFLGSGKTTVLMQLAAWLTKRDDPEPGRNPVVILENEISGASVDGALLAGMNFTVENIFSGCICCTSSFSLAESVRQIREKYDPEWLLIEATGMAYPDSIRKTLREDCELEACVLALADAKRWKRVKAAMPDFLRGQLVDASVILLNKIDLATEEQVTEAEAEIRTFNSNAKLLRFSAVEQHSPDVWDAILAEM